MIVNIYVFISLMFNHSLPPTGEALKTSSISMSSIFIVESICASNRRKKAAVNLLNSILARLMSYGVNSVTFFHTLRTYLIPIHDLDPSPKGTNASLADSFTPAVSHRSGTNVSASVKADSLRCMV